MKPEECVNKYVRVKQTFFDLEDEKFIYRCYEGVVVEDPHDEGLYFLDSHPMIYLGWWEDESIEVLGGIMYEWEKSLEV